ncbi:MAG TPA: hypothetical protein VLT82_15270 [Myxococcaceae bacterium]|nr:hypothetical protein [Myxococcaceae bacterium]
MYRRYTVHRDGDLLVEDLGPDGNPIDPEPVPAEDRFPVELVLLAPDTVDARAQLLDLLELAFEMESTPEGERPPPRPRS